MVYIVSGEALYGKKSVSTLDVTLAASQLEYPIVCLNCDINPASNATQVDLSLFVCNAMKCCQYLSVNFVIHHFLF